MLRCVDCTSLNLLEWRRAYIVMFYAQQNIQRDIMSRSHYIASSVILLWYLTLKTWV